MQAFMDIIYLCRWDHCIVLKCQVLVTQWHSTKRMEPHCRLVTKPTTLTLLNQNVRFCT